MISEPRCARSGDLAQVLACDPIAAASAERQDALAAWVRDGVCLVAELDGGIAGFVVLEHGFFAQGFVPLVCVRADLRRRGVGLVLLAAAERHCRTAKLFTSTNQSNRAAQLLFERAGFAKSGVIDNLDEGDPEIVYFKRVAPR